MSYYGDFTVGSNIKIRFNTRTMAQVPTTFSGSPALAIYKDSTTETSAGVQLSVDYDGRTGLNYVEVDTTADAAFYVAGKDYDVVVTAGTVDGLSVVGEKIATFSIQNRCVTTVTGNVNGSVGSVAGNVGGSVGSVAGNVGGNVAGSVGSVAGDVGGNLNGNVVGDVNGDVVGTVGDTRLDDIKKNTNLIPALL